jgi:hypothetical protein
MLAYGPSSVKRLTLREEHKLRVLRGYWSLNWRMLEGNGWNYRSISRFTVIIKYFREIRLRRMRWRAHVAGQDRRIHSFYGDVWSKRNVGRRGLRWENNIRIDLIKIGRKKRAEVTWLNTEACGPASSVGIATDYGLEGPEIESRWGRDFPHLSRPALGPNQPPVQWVPGLSRG